MKQLKSLEILNFQLEAGIYYKKELEKAIKELEELENRKCDNCLHIRITQTRDYESAICTNEKCDEMFDCSVGDDFYCNKWEQK